jgi:hypothetical protein
MQGFFQVDKAPVWDTVSGGFSFVHCRPGERHNALLLSACFGNGVRMSQEYAVLASSLQIDIL